MLIQSFLSQIRGKSNVTLLIGISTSLSALQFITNTAEENTFKM